MRKEGWSNLPFLYQNRCTNPFFIAISIVSCAEHLLDASSEKENKEEMPVEGPQDETQDALSPETSLSSTCCGRITISPGAERGEA